MLKRLWSRLIRRDDDTRMTPTGETFGERKAYHDRGTLSPGEVALARAPREKLQRDQVKKEE